MRETDMATTAGTRERDFDIVTDRSAEKRAERERLSADIAAFLAAGGQVQPATPGERAACRTGPDGRPVYTIDPAWRERASLAIVVSGGKRDYRRKVRRRSA